MTIIRKNKKKKDCGVVAAYNAAYLSNISKPYEQIEKTARSCGYNPDKGLYCFQFSNLLKKLNVPARKIKPKSMAALASKVYVGKYLVILYTQTGSNNGHAITVIRNHKGYIKVINPMGEIKNWGQLATDIKKYGMKEFHVYELPCKRTKRYDVSRTA